MPWFRVDDGLSDHPKVLAAGNAAMGLWVRAGAWSMKHLSDGFVPDRVAALLGSAREVKALVSSGLWLQADGGYMFHAWEGRQPTREAVLKDREAAAERQKRARERSRESRRDGSVSHGDSSVPPTRPDPTQPNNSSNEVASGGTTGPWCPRHPGGTNDPCGACRTARIAFEAEERRAAEAKANKTPHTKAPRRGDGHECVDDGFGYCKRCVERMT